VGDLLPRRLHLANRRHHLLVGLLEKLSSLVLLYGEEDEPMSRTEAQKQHYQRNRDEILKYHRNYYQKHRKKLAAKARRRYWKKKLESEAVGSPL
jgi:hypothetical protein